MIVLGSRRLTAVSRCPGTHPGSLCACRTSSHHPGTRATGRSGEARVRSAGQPRDREAGDHSGRAGPEPGARQDQGPVSAVQEYLAKALNQPVELFVATDYSGVVEAMASDKLDLAYFGGLTYLQAEKRAQVYPIVTEVDRETHTTKYYSALITQTDSPIQKAEDIKGKKFAFGDINSTSGSLYPRIMLDKAGIGDFTNPSLFVYSGGHDATVLAVQNQTVAAGGVERRIMNRLFEAGTADPSKIRIIQETLVEGYPWCVRAKLDPALVEQITSAFLSMADGDLLKLMRAEKYAKVTAPRTMTKPAAKPPASGW